jgi:CHAD domain-containing protein
MNPRDTLAETSEPPAQPATDRRAEDYLAPALFALVAAVRREADRVAGASQGSDPDAVHDFRVALRRLRTVLRPARALYGKRSLRAVEDELRRFAQATGVLRDEEVLRETLAGLDLPPTARAGVDAWLVQRGRQERARRRRVGALVRGEQGPSDVPGLGETLAQLERRLGHRSRHRQEGRDASSLAVAAVAHAAADVTARLGGLASDVAGMHALRIRYKRLRYTVELFAPLLGDRASAAVAAATRMQKRLGELHDLDEALARVRRARALPPRIRAAVTRALRRARSRRSEGIARDLVDAHTRLPAMVTREVAPAVDTVAAGGG